MKGRIALISALLVSFILFPAVSLAQGQQPPVPRAPTDGSYVLDSLDWLNTQQEASINTTVAKLDSDNLAEVAVVTLNDCGDDKQKFRNDLFRSWGIGHKDKNDGLLILVCWYGGDKSHRSLEQEVGYGLEGTIPDLLSSKVATQYFVPAFKTGAADTDVTKSGKAGEALIAMVNAYDEIIRGSTPKELQSQPNPGGDLLFWILIILIVIIVLLILVAWLGGGSGGGLGSGSSSGLSGLGSSSDSGSSFGGGSSGGGGSSTGF